MKVLKILTFAMMMSGIALAGNPKKGSFESFCKGLLSEEVFRKDPSTLDHVYSKGKLVSVTDKRTGKLYYQCSSDIDEETEKGIFGKKYRYSCLKKRNQFSGLWDPCEAWGPNQKCRNKAAAKLECQKKCGTTEVDTPRGPRC